MINSLKSNMTFVFVAGVLLPISVFMASKMIAVFTMLFLLAHFPYRLKLEKKNWSFFVIPGFMILFYVFNLLGLINSEHISEAWDKLETKLAFIAFGLHMILYSDKKAQGVLGIKWGLIIGGGLSMLFSFFRAAYYYGSDPEILQSNNFGWQLHPSYLALLLIVSCLIIWTIKFDIKRAFLVKSIYCLLALLVIIILRSLGSYICIVIILFSLPLLLSYQSKNWKLLLILPVGIGLFLGLRSQMAAMNGDMTHSLKLAQEWSSDPDEFVVKNRNNIESSTVRLVSWTLSYNMIMENKQGFGTGDSQHELNNVYKANGYTFYAYRSLDPHNQFLNTGIQIGLLGVLFLAVGLVIILWMDIKTLDPFLISIALCVFASLFFESFLERQVGILTLVFYLLISQTRRLENASGH